MKCPVCGEEYKGSCPAVRVYDDLLERAMEPLDPTYTYTVYPVGYTEGGLCDPNRA